MNRTQLKTYAPQARRDFITAVTDRAAYYGLTRDTIAPIIEQGDVVLIAGKPFPRHIAAKRKRLEERIIRQGFEQTMEAMAYTWFNRFAAIRYMELHGYLDHGYRVLSNPVPEKTTPEILEHAEHVDLPGLNQVEVIDLKLDGAKEAELYRMLLIAQCNALHAAMPFLFERIDDETELLLPDNLLHSDSLIRKLVNGIDEEDWQEVEIIGWLYQFYISEKKDQVIGKVVKSEDIPAATQLFTPNWIVKYLVQNSLGRQWMATYPHSPLKQQMAYYIEPAEQTPEVQAQLKAITPESLHPEELTLLDPACGSGHILVEAYDLFKAIYQERGYRARDIPSLILQKNLYGLEIDDRAAQLAAFALMMKARADDRRIFSSGIQPHVLSIQESKGLNAKEITEALNIPLEEGEKQGQKGTIAQADIAQLIGLFEQGKTFGSLIHVPGELAKKLPAIAERVQDVLAYCGMLEQVAARSLRPLIEQVRVLANRYDVVVTNPPYMGSKFCNKRLKEYLNVVFSSGKADLYGAFIQRNLQLAKSFGFVGMITIPNWMFLATFFSLRTHILKTHLIDSLIHNGRGVWGSDFGSCSFVILNVESMKFKGTFRRLFEVQGSVATNEELCKRFHIAKSYYASGEDFQKIPGSPIAYWVSDSVRNVFQAGKSLDEVFKPRKGIDTGNNDLFLRLWFEVDIRRIGFLCTSEDDTIRKGKKWFPYNKGGDYRKWYGNFQYVINWEDGGAAIRNYTDEVGKVKSNLRNQDYFFRQGITWTDVSSSCFGARLLPNGFLCDNSGSACYGDKDIAPIILSFLTTKIAFELLRILNPTLHFQAGNLANLPILPLSDSTYTQIRNLESIAVQIAKDDWDSLEPSWHFKRTGLLIMEDVPSTFEKAYLSYREKCYHMTRDMKSIEKENNCIFIDAYGLHNELSSHIPDDQITLFANPKYRYGAEKSIQEYQQLFREDCVREFLSYAIGCMMGRYSLDRPGLIYAHSGNKGFDPSQYQTFPADDDGIIPMMETDWFPDDATNRLVEFISVAWPKEHLEENLKFIADSLGPNRNEQPRDTIRRYLATGFYKHHLSMYKRRPIYWLFSSGKQRAFQCLVYLHRYHEGTLSRMRTEYVIPIQGKMASRLDQLADDIAAASSTSHRKRLEKARETLRKQHTELQAFDEQLRHYADRRISLDLDDGVKGNYGKFGDLLAEVKAVTGGSMDDAP